MFSCKYESTMKMHDTPHVVVFSNWAPDKTRLSQDRWDITDMTDDLKTWTGSPKEIRAGSLNQKKICKER